MAAAYFRTSDRYWEDVRANLPDLISQIPTKEILPHLTCLSDSDMEKYTKQLERESAAHVNAHLLLQLPKCPDWFLHLKQALVTLRRYQIIDLLNWWDMEDGGEQPGSDRRTRAANQPAVRPSFNQRRGNEDRYFSNNGRDRGAVGYTNDTPNNPTRNSDVNSNGNRRSGNEQRNSVIQRNTDICHYSRTGNRNNSDYVPAVNSRVNKRQTRSDSEHVDMHDRTSSLDVRRTNVSGEFQYQENLNDLSLPNIPVCPDTAVSNNRPNSFNVAPERPPSQADDSTDNNCSVDDNLVTSRTDAEIQQQKLDSYSKQNKIHKSIQNSSKELRNKNPLDNLPINNSPNSDDGSVEMSTDLSRDNMNLEKSDYVKELVKSALKNPELIHNSKGDKQQEDTQQGGNGFQTKGQFGVENTEDQKKYINSDRLVQQITKELKQQHDAYPENEERPFLNPDSEITDPILENKTNQSQLNLYEDNSGDIRDNVSSFTTTVNTACSPPKANLQRRHIPEIPNNPNNTSNMGRNGNGGHFTSFARVTVDSTSNALNTTSTIDLQNEPNREVKVFRNNQELPNDHIDATNPRMNNVAQPSSTARSINSGANSFSYVPTIYLQNEPSHEVAVFRSNQVLPNNHIDATNREVNNVEPPSSTAHSINSGANTSSYAPTIDMLNGPKSEVVGSQIQNNTTTTELEIPPGNKVGISQTPANNSEVSSDTRVAINRATYDNLMSSTLVCPNSLSSNLVNTSSSSQDTTSDTSTFNTFTKTDIQEEREVINGRLHGTGVSLATSDLQTASNSANIPNDTNTDDFSSRVSASTTSTVDPTGLSERGRIRNELRISGMAVGGTDELSSFSCIVDEPDFTATDFSRNRGVSNYQTLSKDLNLSGPSTTSTVDPIGLSRRGRLRNEIRITDITDGQNVDGDRIRQNESTTESNPSGGEQSMETSAIEANAPLLPSEYRMNFEVEVNTDVSSATVDSQTASNVAQISYDTNANDFSSRESASTISTVDPTGVSERGRIRNEHRIFDMADAANFSRNRGINLSGPSTTSTVDPTGFSYDTNANDFSSRESASTISTVDPTGVSERGKIRNEHRIFDMADAANFSRNRGINLSGPSTTSTVDPTGFSRSGRFRSEIRINDVDENESTTYSNPFGDEQSNGISEMAANAPILSSEFRMNFEDGENRGATFDWVKSSHPSESLSLASRVDSSPINFEFRENRATTSRSVSSHDRLGFNQEDEGTNETFSTQEDQPLNLPETGWLSSMNLFPSLSDVMYYALDR